MSRIIPVTVPKWGLAMEEAKVTTWFFAEGAEIAAGQEVVELETSKIANAVETSSAGKLRRIVAQTDDVVVVGGLLGVLSEGDVSDQEIDAFAASFAIEISDEAAAPEPVTIDIGGQRVRYLRIAPEKSEKLPILLVHGYFGELGNWLFLQDRLPRDRTLYAIDLPGHGGSAKDVGAGSIDVFTASIKAFLDAMNIERAHIVGHSMGGAISLKLAIDSPERVASLVTIAAAGFGSPVNDVFIKGMLSAKRARDFKPFAEMLVANPDLVGREMLDDLAKVKRLDGVEASLTKIADATLHDPLNARLAWQVPDTIPLLAIIGEHDQIVPPPTEALPAHFKQQRFAVGHMAQMEAASDVAEAINGHLALLP